MLLLYRIDEQRVAVDRPEREPGADDQLTKCLERLEGPNYGRVTTDLTSS